MGEANEVTIRKVVELDTRKLAPLVEESSGEGFRHLQRLVSDYDSGRNRFDKEGEALFLAYHRHGIAGVGGLNRDPYSEGFKVGRVRRVYVSPGARRLGIGRLMMDAIILEAGKHYVTLVLKTDNPAADGFYRSIGFSVDRKSVV